mmetsp:Transcript_112363/g.348765  ORF Transcript_112363/g.348765 Transcript_112363/m.348765 type:complete len:133 (+) Transcript_112363:3-401(+)
MRQLVDEAAELQDLSDVYEAQISKAQSTGQGLHRASLRRQLDRLDELALRFDSHVPLLLAARSAFDSPQDAPEDVALETAEPVVLDGRGRTASRIAIIEKPSALREQVRDVARQLWRSASMLSSKSNESHAA